MNIQEAIFKVMREYTEGTITEANNVTADTLVMRPFHREKV